MARRKSSSIAGNVAKWGKMAAVEAAGEEEMKLLEAESPWIETRRE